LFLVAIGAILVWGVTTNVAGIDEDAVGWILMVVGIVGLVLSMRSEERRGEAGAVAAAGPMSKKARPAPRTRTSVDLTPGAVLSAAPGNELESRQGIDVGAA